MRYYLGHWQWTTDNGIACYAPPDGVVGCLDLGTLPQMSVGGADRGRLLCWTRDDVMLPSEYELLGVGDCRELNTDGAMLNKFESLVGYRPQGAKLVDAFWDCLEGGADIDGATGPLPLVPTTRGNLELHFAGHSVVKSRRFKWGSDAASPKLKQLLRKEFRGLLQNAKAGKLKDNKHHLRVLDYWCAKYGVSDWKEFVPANLQKDVPGRVKHETTISDNFNRADSTTIVGNQLTWAQVHGVWGTYTNYGYLASGSSGSARAEHDLSSADHYVQVVVTPGGFGNQDSFIGPAARFNAAARTYYFVGSFGGSQYITKFVAGTSTNLVSAVLSYSHGLTYKVQANGSAIKGFSNGAETLSTTDSSITGNLRCGVSSFVVNATLDNFEAADLAAGTVIPVLRHHYVSQGIA